MPTISVRITEEEKKRLLEHGALSKSVREALDLYLSTKQSEELMARLEKLQKQDVLKTSASEDARMIDEDRER